MGPARLSELRGRPEPGLLELLLKCVSPFTPESLARATRARNSSSFVCIDTPGEVFALTSSSLTDLCGHRETGLLEPLLKCAGHCAPESLAGGTCERGHIACKRFVRVCVDTPVEVFALTSSSSLELCCRLECGLPELFLNFVDLCTPGS